MMIVKKDNQDDRDNKDSKEDTKYIKCNKKLSVMLDETGANSEY